MFHLLVRTLSGALYTFRIFHESGNVYVTSVGSSSGHDLVNTLVLPQSVVLERGHRMTLRDIEGYPLVYTSRVAYWEIVPIMGGMTVTSHDDVAPVYLT